MYASPRRLVAALAVAALAAAGAAAAAPSSAASSSGGADTRVVLSVTPGFDPSALPTGSSVTDSYRHVGAVLVTLPAAAVSQLAEVPGVRGVRPDYRLSVANNDSPSAGGVLAPSTLGAPAGSSTAGAGVTVAVLDTGVADTAALNRASGRLITGVDTSDEKKIARDGYGHGTFMAGLIAGGAVAGQQIGVAPAARVVDVKVAMADGSTSLSKVLAGLDWVANQRTRLGIRVLNLSLAAERPTDGYGRDPLTDGAEAVRNAGVVVAVSSGNKAGTLGTPGLDPLLMSVGAADTRGTAATAEFSGSGVVAGMPRPDVVASGVAMVSVMPADSVIAKTYPASSLGGGLYRGSGTSQATAVTAGAVAVFLSGKSGVSPDDVRASFATVAKDLKGTADGSGLITLPTQVVRWSAEAAGGGSGNASDPSTSGTSWSGTSWSGTSWSGTSWSGSSWSGTSWSGTSWSGTSWSGTSWSGTSWSGTSWSFR